MENVAQLVEPRIVIPISEGSNPFILPKDFIPLAQWIRAIGYEPIGRQIKSVRGCQIYVSLA